MRKRIGTRLGFGILITVLGMLIICGVSIYTMNQMIGVWGFIRGERLAAVIGAREAEIAYREYLLTGSEESKERLFLYLKPVSYYATGLGKMFGGNKDAGEDLLKKNRELLSIPEFEGDAVSPRAADALVNLTLKFWWVPKVKKLLQICVIGGGKAKKLIFTFRVFVTAQEAGRDTTALQAKIEWLFDEVRLLSSEFSKSTREVIFLIIKILTLTMLTISTLCIGFGSIAAILITRSITIPISKFVTASKIIAEGDLTYRVDIKSKDEIGNLAAAFNQMTGKLKKSMDETKARTRELELTQAQLVQSAKMVAVGQLGAGVAHELNNPLGGILGYAQFLLDKYQRPDFSLEDFKACHRYIENIEREAVRCRKIVENLLTFSRKPASFNPIALDIGRIIEETLSIIGHQLSITNVDIITDIKPDLAEVMGVSNLLQQVFTNLILNAQQAMKHKEEAELRITAENIIDEKTGKPTDVRIEFKDTGTGVSLDIIGRVFEPFFTTKQKEKGTGLGLSVSYQIVQDHDGTFDVVSEEGEGATFIVILPVAKERALR